MGRKSRLEYLRSIFHRYRKADRKTKGRILDEFCQVAHFHRKYALRLLNGPPPGPSTPRGRRRRAPLYSGRVVGILETIWVAAGYPCSVRLKALLPLWLRRAGRRFTLTPGEVHQLRTISPRQMDRRLQVRKRHLKRRLYGRTKPGTLLKHQIPLKTDHWDVCEPGYGEGDLVAHCGNSADGEFAHTLDFTDIHTTWVERRCLLGRSQGRVRQAVDQIRHALPFPLLGFDSDNGSEFINLELFQYCQEHGVQFTRGRPYKKDDNAYVEQKNWTHVRQVLGYARFDTPEAVQAINDLYCHELRLFQNLFLPSMKLAKKLRVGSRLRRTYDRPQTPLDRVLACPQANPKACTRLKMLRDRLDPFDLSRRIDEKIQRILALPVAVPDRQRRHPRRGRPFQIHPERSIDSLRRAGAPV